MATNNSTDSIIVIKVYSDDLAIFLTFIALLNCGVERFLQVFINTFDEYKYSCTCSIFNVRQFTFKNERPGSALE